MLEPAFYDRASERRNYDKRSLRPALFGYQRELVRRIHTGETLKALLALPTGAGKTRAVVATVLGMLGSGDARCVVWLAPSLELVDQAADTFANLWHFQGDLERWHLTRLVNERCDEPSVVLTTPQMLHSRQDSRVPLLGGQVPDVVVFDEAHQLGAPTFGSAVECLGVEFGSRTRSAQGTRLLGLSATPGRVDPDETEDLVSMFDGSLLTCSSLEPNPVQALQRRGILSRLEFKPFTKKAVPSEDEGRRLLIAARACLALVKRNRKPLVFAASVPGAIVLAEALRSRGLRAEALHSEVPTEQRRAIIAAFAQGKLDVLTNQRLLATGYDCPAVTDVLILGRVTSPILFEQMVGRAARGPRTGGTRVATIWDFDDHLSIHGRPSSYYRYKDFDWKT